MSAEYTESTTVGAVGGEEAKVTMQKTEGDVKEESASEEGRKTEATV